MFGYLLSPDTSQQKIFVLISPPRGGKGTIARVLRGMVGPENFSGPTLASLAQPFGLWALIGQSVAVIPDARLSGRTDKAIITERLLAISGEDTLTIDRKCLPSIHAKLPTRLVILSNEIPRLADASGTIASRMVALRMNRSWLGKEDPGLTQRLLAELPGILLWAIGGWARLRHRGHLSSRRAAPPWCAKLRNSPAPWARSLSSGASLGRRIKCRAKSYSTATWNGASRKAKLPR